MISAARSRQIARALVKQEYPNLLRDEVVHHVNHDPSDNRLGNLVIMDSGEHTSYHLKGKVHSLSKERLLRALDKLESWIELYNYYLASG